MPKFALLIPCYNAEKYISSFLENISLLTYKFDEIIFYDDGSSDNTLNILKQNNCFVIDGKTNKGPGYSRNRLAEISSGNYIHFHDIDDEFTPEFISLLNEIKLSNSDVLLGNADWIEQRTRKPVIQWRYNQQEIDVDPLKYFITHPLGIINTVYKKETFLKLGGFNEILNCWEDTDLHIRLAAANASFNVINKVVAYSIRHNNGISRNQNWCWECRFEYLKSYLNSFPQIYKQDILLQILRCIEEFYASDNKQLFNESINLAVENGLELPRTNNTFLKILQKAGFSPSFLFGIQYIMRKLARK